MSGESAASAARRVEDAPAMPTERIDTRPPVSRMRRAGAAITVLALLGLVSACTSASAGSTAANQSYGSAAGTAAGTTAGKNDVAAASAPVAGAAAQKATQDRSVTVTGSLGLRATHPIDAATAISQLVTAGGGRIANLDEQPKHAASARLTARIPAASFSTALAAIEKEGTVTTVSIEETDVTDQVTDYAVRSRTLQQSITRLQGLLARASTSSDLVTIETTLEQRETQLETLLAQQKSLTDQVSYATLSITIASPAAPVRTTNPTNFASAFVAGFLGLVATGGVLAVVVGVVLPWLVALAVIGAIVLLIVRAARRRGTPKADASV
jgi:Domain of unknown function (DUF4349)